MDLGDDNDESEHGNSEHIELFLRIINSIISVASKYNHYNLKSHPLNYEKNQLEAI